MQHRHEMGPPDVRREGWFQYIAGSKWRRKRRRRPSPIDNIEGDITAIKPLDHDQLQLQLQWPHASADWVQAGAGGGEVKVVQVYAAPYSPAAGEANFAHDVLPSCRPQEHFLHLQCEVEFDPEKDYAQVLAEARSHLKVANTLGSNNVASPPWNHLDAYKELQSKLGKPQKPSRLRRFLFFWQRPSNISQQQMEAEFESIFSSPLHPALKISQNAICRDARKAQKNGSIERPNRKGASGPLEHHAASTRRDNSGPLYTDGLPVGPFNIKHSKKSYSGPLGSMSCGNMVSYPSPYQPLQRAPSSSPLYSS